MVNSDDPLGREILAENPNAISYGIENPADVFAINVKEDIEGTDYVLNLFDSVFNINTRLLGTFNVYNSLAAGVACSLLGVKVKDVSSALGDTGEVEGRPERAREKRRTRFRRLRAYPRRSGKQPENVEKSYEKPVELRFRLRREQGREQARRYGRGRGAAGGFYGDHFG